MLADRRRLVARFEISWVYSGWFACGAAVYYLASPRRRRGGGVRARAVCLAFGTDFRLLRVRRAAARSAPSDSSGRN